MKRRVAILCALVAIALFTPVARTAPPLPPSYVAIDIGTLPGGTFAGAYDINAGGQIVGLSDSASSGILTHASCGRTG